MGIWRGIMGSQGIMEMIVATDFALYVFINGKTNLKALSRPVTRETARIYHVY